MSARALLYIFLGLGAFGTLTAATELTLQAPLDYQVTQRTSPAKGLLRVAGKSTDLIPADAGIAAPTQMEGRSLRPLVEGKDTAWRDELFIESLFTMRDCPFQEGMRTSRWKYIRMYDGVMSFKEAHVDFQGRAPEFEMLFDLEADPTEHHNLATDPKHAAILAELREKTAAQSIAINQRRAEYMKATPVQPRTVGAGKKARK